MLRRNCCGGIAAITGTSAGTASMSNGSKAPGEVLPPLNNISLDISLPSIDEQWITPTPAPSKPSPPPPPSQPSNSGGQNQEKGDQSSQGKEPPSSGEQSDSSKDPQELQSQQEKGSQEPQPEPPPTASEPEAPSKTPDSSQPPTQTPDASQLQNGNPDGNLDPCQLLYETSLLLTLKPLDAPKLSDLTETMGYISELSKITEAIKQTENDLSKLGCKSIPAP